MNTYTGGIVAELLNSGEAKEHIEIIRNEQKEKMKATLEILRENLPPSCKLINEPEVILTCYILYTINVLIEFREATLCLFDCQRVLIRLELLDTCVKSMIFWFWMENVFLSAVREKLKMALESRLPILTSKTSSVQSKLFVTR